MSGSFIFIKKGWLKKMECINLKKKAIVEVDINGKECELSLDLASIDHFQKANKIGISEALERMQKNDFSMIYSLICSLIKDKKSKRILGRKFFDDYDELDLITQLYPAIEELVINNTPKAKQDSEKK